MLGKLRISADDEAVDDGDVRIRQQVGRSEGAPLHDRDAERVEVARVGIAGRQQWWLRGQRSRALCLERDPEGEPVRAAGRPAHHAHRLHAGQRAQPFGMSCLHPNLQFRKARRTKTRHSMPHFSVR